MNLTHLHLLLSHLVVMAALFSAAVFLLGFLRKNETIRKLALFGFVIAAMSAIPVFLAGESAEESVEHLTGVSESIIDSHEDAATFSFWTIEIAGTLALGALFLKKIPAFKNSIFTGAMVLISLVSAGAISYTGYLGGQIRHTEISGNAALQSGEQGGEQAEVGADQDDD